MVLLGHVATGLGKGAEKMRLLLSRLVMLPQGERQMVPEELFVDFYPGTLNVSLALPWETPTKGVLRVEKEAYGGDGGITFVPCRIARQHHGVEGGGDVVQSGYIVRPDMTIHPSTLVEIVATRSLRRELSLEDGFPVQIDVLG